MKKKGFILTLIVLLLFSMAAPVQAQRRGRNTGQQFGVRQEKKVIPPDSLELARRDSLHFADSLHRIDSIALLGKRTVS